MMKIHIKVKIKCPKHPKYNPEKHGRGGIKGGCSECNRMFAIYSVAEDMKRLSTELKAADMPEE